MRKISALITFIALIVLIIISSLAAAQTAPFPTAPTSLTNRSSFTQNSTIGAQINASGGTINEYNFGAITINYRWKAYVGNVSGSLSLLDAGTNSLYDWSVTSVTGEVFATRNTTSINWDAMSCANSSTIALEQASLNHNHSAIDTINITFNHTNHGSFYAGISLINANSCRATHLNVNSTAQSTYFAEVLLQERNVLIYAALLENHKPGFNNHTYDYQMLLPENAAEGPNPSTAYYFYVELV